MKYLLLLSFAFLIQTGYAQTPIEERYPIGNYEYFIGTWEGTTDGSDKFVVIFDKQDRVSTSDGNVRRYLVGQYSYYKNGELIESTIDNALYAIDLGLMGRSFKFNTLKLAYVRDKDTVDQIELLMDGKDHVLNWKLSPLKHEGIKFEGQPKPKLVPYLIPTHITLKKIE